MAINKKRIQKELDSARAMDRVLDLKVTGSETRLRTFFEGAPDSPFEGGRYEVEVTFGKDYPLKPPAVIMLSPIFHPNFSGDQICVDFLQNNWSPSLTISAMLNSFQLLLDDPNPDSALDSDAASVYQSDPDEYKRRNQELIKSNEKLKKEGEEEEKEDI